MKLIRAWLATCSRCKETTQVYSSESNITQDRAEEKLRAEGWGTTNGEPLCPECNNKRPGVFSIIQVLKSATTGDD